MKNFNSKSKIEQVEKLADDNLEITFYENDGENYSTIKINKSEFESWLLANEVVQKYTNNEDSQQAAFDDYYSDTNSLHRDIKDYILQEDICRLAGDLAVIDFATGAKKEEIKKSIISELDFTEDFYHENVIAI